MSVSIAHYDILSTVGSGAVGVVYRARDTKVGRTVAIRVLTQGMDDPARRARAIDVVRPYTALTHPHVATLFEVGEQRGSVYLVYEFVPGEKLSAAVAGQPMNLRRALDLGSQLADALADAHALGLLHGALTASSVMVTPKGHAKILDFGLLAGLPDTSGMAFENLPAADRQAARVEAIGRIRVAHSAPEQLLGQTPDQRADIFALGTLLHEMVTGRHAFAGRTTLEVGVHVLRLRPPSPSVLAPGVPRSVDRIVDKALAKKPDDRYQSAALLSADIRAAAADTHNEPAGHKPATRTGRSPWRLALVGALLLVTAALAAWHWREPLRQRWEGRFGEQLAPVLVVVPYHVATADPQRAYYGAGFAEDLARQLGHIQGITVLGRSSIRALAGKSPQAAAEAFRTGLALAGSLKPLDDEWTSFDVESRLVDRQTGRVIWTKKETCAAQDLVALQAAITREVAAWLRIAYQPTAEHSRATLRLVNPSAYDKYLQARQAMASYDASRAVQLFEDAAVEDPSLIEAQSGLAEALYVVSAFEGRERFGDVRPRARRAAESAFATDPDLAATRLAMGLTASTSREAIEELRRSIEIDRSFPGAYLALADVLLPIDPGRAAGFVQHAAELDPAQPRVYFGLAAAGLSAGELDGALLAMARGQALAPTLPWWDAIRDRVALARKPAADSAPGRDARDARDAGDFPPGIVLRAASLGVAGRASEASALAGTLARRHPGSCEARAVLAAALIQGGRPAEGMRAAAELAARAAAAPEGSGWAGCAVIAAAATGDAAAAAAALARIATSDAELRAWGTVNPVLDGQSSLRQGVFPWSKVASSPAVAAAMARVDRALVKARADAARILQGM